MLTARAKCNSKKELCTSCYGAGRISVMRLPHTYERRCQYCNGTGFKINDKDNVFRVYVDDKKLRENCDGK